MKLQMISLNKSKEFTPLRHVSASQEPNEKYSSNKVESIVRSADKDNNFSQNKSKVSIIIDKSKEEQDDVELDEDAQGELKASNKKFNSTEDFKGQYFSSYNRKAHSKLNKMLEVNGDNEGRRHEHYLKNFQAKNSRKFESFMNDANSTSIRSMAVSPNSKTALFNSSKSNSQLTKDFRASFKSLKQSTNMEKSQNFVEKTINYFSIQERSASRASKNEIISKGAYISSASSYNYNTNTAVTAAATPFNKKTQNNSRMSATAGAGEQRKKKFFSPDLIKMNNIEKNQSQANQIEKRRNMSPQKMGDEQSDQQISLLQKSPIKDELAQNTNSSRKITFKNSKKLFSHSLSQQQLQFKNPYLEEMNNNFRISLNLLDLSEMKKFSFKDTSSSITYLDAPKQIKKEQIFRQNVYSMDQQLNQGRSNLVELGMNEFTYFSIRVKGQQNPLKIRIQQDQHCFFKLLVSRQSTTPSQFNCDFQIQGNSFQFETEDNSSIFHKQDFFFFAVFSSEESIIKVSFYFGNEQDSIKVCRDLKQEQFITRPRSENNIKIKDLSNNQLKLEVRNILERRKMKIGLLGNGGQNLVQKNIDNIKEYNGIEAFKQRITDLEQKKIKIVQTRENHLQLMEAHFLQLTKQKEDKEIKKQNLILSKMLKIKSFKKKTFDFFWITNIVLTIVVNKIAVRLVNHKQRQRIMRDMAFSLLRPFFRYKNRVRKIGGANVDVRAILDCKFTLDIYSQVKKPKIKQEAKNILIHVLQANEWRFSAIQKVKDYIFYSKKLLNHLKAFRFKVQSFKKLLFRIWEKYYFDIISEILEIKPVLISKDPTLSKRIMQNIYQSFNHIDYKKAAIEQYYKTILRSYINATDSNHGSNTPSLYLSPRQISPRSELKSQSNFFQTQIPGISSLKSHIQTQVVTIDENIDPKLLEQQQQEIQNECIYLIKKESLPIPRLFVIPQRQQLKDIMFQTAQAVYLNYPELQKKVSFKYSPL